MKLMFVLAKYSQVEVYLEAANTKVILSFDIILMSTLTWITEKETERETKKQRRPILLNEKHENL